MRVGIDARAWGWTGIGRYARNLVAQLSALASRDTERKWEFLVFTTPQSAGEVARMPGVRVFPVRDSYYSLYEQTGFLKQLLSVPLDLMHFLNFNRPVLYRRPFLVTIHDLTRFHFRGQRHRSWFRQVLYERVFHASVRGAEHIIAVSHDTRANLTRRFPSTASKTSVIYEGVDQRFFVSPSAEDERRARDRLRERGIHEPYLLYVGLWMEHKNLPGLIRAFRLARDAGFSGTLVITGEGRPWDVNVRALAVAEGVNAQLVLPGYVPDDDLPALYRGAEALVFPSFSEGFGLPPLEAMAVGTPVVAARSGSLPEVLGSAAAYSDAGDAHALATSVTRVLRDGEFRARLVAAGRARARQFPWSTCGERTLELYATLGG